VPVYDPRLVVLITHLLHIYCRLDMLELFSKSKKKWEEIFKDVYDVARSALKNLVIQSTPPLPVFYEREFVEVAKSLKKDDLVMVATGDKALFEQKLLDTVHATRDSVYSARNILLDFEKEAEKCIGQIEQDLTGMREQLVRMDKEADIVFSKDADSIQTVNERFQNRLTDAISGMKKQEAVLDELRRHVRLDPLTNIYNRRSWDNDLNEMVMQALEDSGEQGPIAIIIADLDHFKKINDNHGHPVGDAVLKQFAGLLQEHFKGAGSVYRYGGEEFGIILTGMSGDAVMDIAGRFKDRLMRSCFTADRGRIRMKITASFGICEWKPSISKEMLVKAADDALYEAKRTGRNKIVAARTFQKAV